MTVTNGYGAELPLLYGVLEQGWMKRYRAYPVAKPWGKEVNRDTDCKVNGKPIPYLRLSRRGAGGRPIEIGSPGANSSAFTSIGIIDIFVPKADGAPLASQYADELMDDFAAFFRVPGLLRLRRIDYGDVGVESTGIWYQGSLTITYERHRAQ